MDFQRKTIYLRFSNFRIFNVTIQLSASHCTVIVIVNESPVRRRTLTLFIRISTTDNVRLSVDMQFVHQRATEVNVFGNGPRIAMFSQQGVRQREMSVSNATHRRAYGSGANFKSNLVNHFHKIRSRLVDCVNFCQATSETTQTSAYR